MLLINFSVSILTIVFCGYIILALLNFKNHNLFESLALSFGLGAGFVGVSMFFLSLTGIPLNVWLIILPQLILFFIYLYKFKFSRIANHKISFKFKFSFFEFILIFFILFEIFFVILDAGSMPFLAWDAWCNWGFKAKMIFSNKAFLYQEWLKSPNIPHLNYPLLLPMQEAYIYIFLNRIYEPFARIFCSFYFVGLISLLYGFLAREFSRKLALFTCFILSITPILLREAARGYADVQLSFYVALAILNLRYYIKKQENVRLWLGCIFLGLSMWVKNEGMSFWLAIILSLILMMLLAPKLFKQKTKAIVTTIFIPWIIFSPWLLLRIILNIKGERYLRSISALCILLVERSNVMLKALLFQFTRFNHWNISWFIFLLAIVIIIFRNKKDKIGLFILFVILFQFIFSIGAFIVFPWTLKEMVEWCKSSLHRPLLQIYPIILFFIAQSIGMLKIDRIVRDKDSNE